MDVKYTLSVYLSVCLYIQGLNTTHVQYLYGVKRAMVVSLQNKKLNVDQVTNASTQTSERSVTKIYKPLCKLRHTNTEPNSCLGHTAVRTPFASQSHRVMKSHLEKKSSTRAARAKMVWYWQAGIPVRDISHHTGVSVTTVYRWVRRWQEEGSVETRSYRRKTIPSHALLHPSVCPLKCGVAMCQSSGSQSHSMLSLSRVVSSQEYPPPWYDHIIHQYKNACISTNFMAKSLP